MIATLEARRGEWWLSLVNEAGASAIEEARKAASQMQAGGFAIAVCGDRDVAGLLVCARTGRAVAAFRFERH